MQVYLTVGSNGMAENAKDGYVKDTLEDSLRVTKNLGL